MGARVPDSAESRKGPRMDFGKSGFWRSCQSRNASPPRNHRHSYAIGSGDFRHCAGAGEAVRWGYEPPETIPPSQRHRHDAGRVNTGGSVPFVLVVRGNQSKGARRNERQGTGGACSDGADVRPWRVCRSQQVNHLLQLSIAALASNTYWDGMPARSATRDPCISARMYRSDAVTVFFRTLRVGASIALSSSV